LPAVEKGSYETVFINRGNPFNDIAMWIDVVVINAAEENLENSLCSSEERKCEYIRIQRIKAAE
jgi:hypothetical protein